MGGKERKVQDKGDICIIMSEFHCWMQKPMHYSNFPAIKDLRKIIIIKPLLSTLFPILYSSFLFPFLTQLNLTLIL